MSALSAPRRAGHIVGIVMSALNVVSSALPTDPTQPGPPMPVIAFGVGVGIVSILLLVWSWRADARWPRRAAAVLMILAALTAVPAFLVEGVPALLRLIAGAFVLLTVATVVLLFYPERVGVSAATSDAGSPRRSGVAG